MGHERKERLEPATGRLPGVVKAALQEGTEYINRWKYVVALRDRASRRQFYNFASLSILLYCFTAFVHS